MTTATDFEYDVTRADLAQLATVIGQASPARWRRRDASPDLLRLLRAAGEATVNQLEGFDVSALALTGQYDVTVPSGEHRARNGPRQRPWRVPDGLGPADAGRDGHHHLRRAAAWLRHAPRCSGKDETASSPAPCVLDADRREASLLDLTRHASAALPWRLAPRGAAADRVVERSGTRGDAARVRRRRQRCADRHRRARGATTAPARSA